jgi:hypothetical protein
MIITDEMVEVAREAMESYPMRDEVRAALEAVAPMLIAQGICLARDKVLGGSFLTEDAPVHKWAREVAAMLDREADALRSSPGPQGA